jgi:hypothetical protein
MWNYDDLRVTCPHCNTIIPEREVWNMPLAGTNKPYICKNCKGGIFAVIR